MYQRLILLGLWLVMGSFLSAEAEAQISFRQESLIATNIGQLYQLGNIDANPACSVHLTAVICWVNPANNSAIIEDDSAAVWIDLNTIKTGSHQVGDRVVLTGRFALSGNKLMSRPLVDNDGIHGVTEQSGRAFFKAGRHPITVTWFDDLAPSSLEVSFEGPDLPKQKIPDSALHRPNIDSVTGNTNWQQGLEYRCFEGKWSQLPDFEKLTPVKNGVSANFEITHKTQEGGAGMEFKGFIDLPKDGEYTFYTSSDDGSKLWVGSRELETLLSNGIVPIRRLTAGQKLAVAQWGDAEGTVQFVSRNEQGSQIELESEDGRMLVQIPDVASGQYVRFLGKKVRVEGFAEPLLSESGDLIAGKLWAPDPEAVFLVEPSLAEWLGWPLYSLRTLTATHTGRPLKKVTQYSITSANDYPARDPKDWELLGSNDGDMWTLLDRRRDEAFADRFQKKTFSLTNSNAFNVYRLKIDANDGTVPTNYSSFQFQMIQLSEIELLDSSAKGQEFEEDTEKEVSASADFPPAETKEMAFDGRNKTKWLARTTNAWIQVQYAWLSVPSNRVIRVHGTVVEQKPDSLIIADGSSSLTIRTTQQQGLILGQEVQAAGFLDKTAAGLELSGAFVQPGESRASMFIDEQPSNSLVLTNVAQILRLTRDDQLRNIPVQIRGVITCFIDAGERNYRETLRTIQDSTGAICLHWSWDGPVKVGDLVEIKGYVDVWANAPIIVPGDCAVLAKANMPKPSHPSWEALRTGETENQWIEVHGVVHSVAKDRLLLRVKGGLVNVRMKSIDPALLSQLVDATVTVRGVYHVNYNRNFQMLSFMIETPGMEYVQVDEPAPNDPFTLPSQLATNLLRAGSVEELAHRVKVGGIVTYSDAGSCYVQDGSGVVSARLAKRGDLKAGNKVELVGFPEPGGYVPVLVETEIRTQGTSVIPPAPRLTLEDFIKGNREGQLMTLEAICLGRSVRGPNQILELLAEHQTFRALLPTNSGILPNVPAGSRIDVSGVCRMDASTLRQPGQTSTSFEILMNAPSDVVIRQRPSWWTLQHTAAVVTVMGLILGAAFAWIRTLRGKVDERTRELKEEIEERKRTELELKDKTGLLKDEIEERKQIQGRLEKEIEERERLEQEKERINKELLATSRRAGMAEVASGVLHNVGNVLNSVNVSASVIADKIGQSKAASIGKVAAIINEHGDDLAKFLTEDEKGKKLPTYLNVLTENIKREQQELHAELNGLCSNIDHIKQVIAMQQNYARVSGVLEPVGVQDLVEDALKIHVGSYLRHAVNLKREYGDAPSVTTDKHKVLQILVNLFQNAKHACDESRRSDKQVVVRIRKNEANCVQIQVSDNGVGIPAENLTRIFNHGFTTRQGGHGFGLHSGALAAKELGGTLSVQSEGVGKGATFTLELPITRDA